MKTVDEWMEDLKDKSLEWLVNQTSPYIRGYNWKEYDTAVHALKKMKLDMGERIERRRRSCVVPSEDDVDAANVEIIPFGGKGGTIRIVHPK